MSAGAPIRISPADLAPDDLFGSAIAMSGNVLASASYYGSIYIYRFDGSNWNQEQKITGDSFFAVAIDGDVLIAGGTAGATIYRFNGTVWALEQFINVPSIKVDIDGDNAIMGDYNSTSANVYHHTGGIWTHQQTLSVAAGSSTTTVAISGNSLAVGGISTVTLFRFDGVTWQLETTLHPGILPANGVGYPLAMDNDYFAVSSVRTTGGRAVQIYKDVAGNWVLQQELNPPGGASDENQEGALAMEGDLLAVGNPFDRGGQGSAWVYRNCAGVWAIERAINGPAGATVPTLFGFSVALSGGLLGVGSPYDDLEGKGAVYVDAAGVDCNQNGVHDGCERLNAPAMDCDQNVILDDCESNADCNLNGFRDRCDIATSVSKDCNANLVPDECDIGSGMSADLDTDGIPDECLVLVCENPQGGPLYSLKAASINGERITPRNEITIRPGDVLTTEIFLSCWGSVLDVVRTFQVSILTRDGAISGTVGTLLPVGWDAPVDPQSCPCTTPPYLTCDPLGICTGTNFDPDLGAYMSVDRPDFIFQGFSGLVAVSPFYLGHYRYGGTTSFGDGPADLGLARYIGTLELLAGDTACGTFEFSFLSDIGYTFIANAAEPLPTYVLPQLQSLTIHVCEDDGLFCNGLETCDAQLGCRIIPPPSCDDGVACTIDSCDEAANGCAHALSHAACDDGDICTTDECTPTGCTHVDDQCGDIPTTSQWGLVMLALCLLIAAKVRFRTRLA